MRYVKLFLTAISLTFVLDIIWIGGFAMNFYRSMLGSLLADSVNWPAAILFYIFFTIALIVFVLEPALKARSMQKSLVLGALFGFALYMTYDLTNLATARDWSVLIAVVDMVWGTILTAIVSVGTYWMATKVFKM